MYNRLFLKENHSFFLFGPRGSGKTTWLKALYPDAFFLNLLLEEKLQNYLMDPGQFEREVRARPAEQWIFIDEVQRAPALLNYVHHLIETEKRKFILCGSSARKLKQSGVNLLAGRALFRQFHPLLPQELGADFSIERVLRQGSLPLIWNAEDPKETLNAYTQLYVTEEIKNEALVRNLPAFLRFLPVSALVHGQTLSISSLARDAGAHRNTIAGYVQILEDTMLAFQIPAYTPKLRVLEKQHPKFYFVDPGIVRSLKKQFGSVAQEEKGPLFEGLVAETLRALNDYTKSGLFHSMSYWAASGSDLEVDFILERENEIFAIEAKASSAVHGEHLKGLRSLSKLKGLSKRILVYLGQTKQQTEDGILILPYLDFVEWLSAQN